MAKILRQVGPVAARSPDEALNSAAAVPGMKFDRRIVVLAASIFATGTDASVIAGIMPGIADDLTISVSVAGQLLTIYMLTYSIGSPFLAAFSANWSRRRLFILCLSMFALADGLCAIAPTFGILIAARFAAACFSAAYTPAAFGMAAELSPPDRRGAGLAALSFGLLSAQLVGVPVGIWAGQHFGWRATFVLDFAVVSIAALSVWLAALPSEPPRTVPGLWARFAPLTNPRLLLAILPYAFWTTGFNVIFVYIAVIFGTRVGLDKVPLLFVFLGLGGMVGSQLGGRLADRLGTTTPILSCLILGAVAIALTNVIPGTIVPSAALVAAIASVGWALYPLQQARMIALAPMHAAVVVSLVNSAAYLGTACAAALGAATLAQFSPFYMPYAAIGALISAIALFAISRWVLPPSAAAEPKASP